MLGAPELLIVALVVFVLFGASKLPKLARSLGEAKHELDKGMREAERRDEAGVCPRCGHEVGAEARFCPSCGAPVGGDRATAVEA